MESNLNVFKWCEGTGKSKVFENKVCFSCKGDGKKHEFNLDEDIIKCKTVN